MRAPFLALLLSLPGLALAQAKPMVYCADASPEGFDPGRWDSGSTANVTRQMFQGLLTFQRGGTALRPELATAWQMSDDAKVFTFQLRQGVRFHTTPEFKPSRAFNADDVLFTFQRFIQPEHPINRAAPTVYTYPQSLGLDRQIEAIEKLSEHELRFRLRAPNVSFASYLAMSFAAIQSAEYAAQLLQQNRAFALNNKPVGTGPYRFRSYAKDEVLRLEANPDYWGQAQKTKALIFAFAREPNVRVQKLLAGECHIGSPLRDVDVNTVLKRPDTLQLFQIQALNISYLAFNLKKPPLTDRRVREALDIAVDRNAVFKALFPRGDAQQAVNAMPPSIPGWNPDLKNEFNPERAKQLLAEAGFPNGFEIDLWALPVQRPTNPNGALMAQLIQQDWARIGVRAPIKTFEWGEYLKRANKGEHHVYMSGWSGDSGDADDFLAPNLSCASSKGGIKFCDPAFDALLERARATADGDERARLYREANALFKRERPWITIAHSTIYIAASRDLRGFVISPNGGMDFEGVYRD
jgi:ABC-type transport system substrate-binding protein